MTVLVIPSSQSGVVSGNSSGVMKSEEPRRVLAVCETVISLLGGFCG
jgi:hypothetical protein